MFQVGTQFSGGNIPRTVRLTGKLFHKLTTTATGNNISFNLLVLQCCQYALDHLEKEKQATPTAAASIHLP